MAQWLQAPRDAASNGEQERGGGRREGVRVDRVVFRGFGRSTGQFLEPQGLKPTGRKGGEWGSTDTRQTSFSWQGSSSLLAQVCQTESLEL